MNADVDISKRSELFWGRHSENDLHWKNAFDSSQPLKQIAYGIVEIKKSWRSSLYYTEFCKNAW